MGKENKAVEVATPAPGLALAMIQDDYQRLQRELGTLTQHKQENDRQRMELDTAIVAQRGAIAYVEMLLQRAQDSAGEQEAAP